MMRGEWMTGANRIILEIEECLFRKNKLQINEKVSIKMEQI